MRAPLLLVLVLALVAAGCGGYSGPPRGEGAATGAETTEDFLAGEADGSAAMGGGGAKISVGDAIELSLVGELFVEGYAVQEGGNTLLCEKVTAAGGCGEPSLLMQGYDGEFSTETKTVVPGEVNGDVIIVSG